MDQIFQRSALTNIILYYYDALFLMAKKASDVPTKWDEKSNDETIFPWGGKKTTTLKSQFPKKGEIQYLQFFTY